MVLAKVHMQGLQGGAIRGSPASKPMKPGVDHSEASDRPTLSQSQVPRGEHTIVHALRRAAASHPTKPWVRTEESELTFSAADTLSDRLANGLLAMGVGQGDTVLVFMPDSTDYLCLWVALSKIGAIEVPININYRGDILRHVVENSRARLAIVGDQLVERIAELADAFSHLQAVVVHGASEDTAEAFRMPVHSFSALIGAPDPIAHEPNGRDLMSVMYTSGTTGPSKGVMICHAHAYCYAWGNIELLEIGPDDIYFSAGLPMFHVAGKWGVFLAAAIRRCTVAMPRQFSVSRFWEVSDKFGATKAFLLGSMANLLQRRPPQEDDRQHSLRKIIMAPLLADAGAFVERFGIHICQGFGATEFNTCILLHDADNAPDPTCVGRVRSDFFEVRVVDENDEEVPPDILGEIVVRPKYPWLITPGYWHRPEATVAAWRNLWFHTGDLGRYDAQGLFYFVDRIKDAIRRRGENISSMEVEGIICQHPAVQECAVFPIASEFSEQEVMVSIVEKPDAHLDPIDLVGFLEPRMPYFMVPRYVDVVADLPKTPSGKITKVELRARGLTATTWDREKANVTLKR